METMDYRIFAGAFLEGELAGRIQALRERWDPQTARITPPHVTLAGTYWRDGPASPENEAETIELLGAVSQQVISFDLALGGVRSFPPVERPVIYLAVDLTPGLLAARRALLDLLGPDKHRRFTPHLTLAMRLKGRQAQAMLAELDGSEWNTDRWHAPVRELRLMQRGPADPAWRTIASFPLLTGSSEGALNG